VGSPCDVLDQGQQGGALRDALFEGDGELAIACLRLSDSLTGEYLGGDVPEIADHAVAAILERDAVALPLVVLGHPAIAALLAPLGGHVRLSGSERVAEEADDFIGVCLRPAAVGHPLADPA